MSLISDGAVLAFLERVQGLDVEGLRSALEQEMKPLAVDGVLKPGRYPLLFAPGYVAVVLQERVWTIERAKVPRGT